MTLSELFSDESRWAKRAEARTLYGGRCSPLSKDARSFCLYGGIEKYRSGSYRGAESCLSAYSARRAVAEAVKEFFPERCSSGFSNISIISGFNDHPETTIEDVRKVVALAESRLEES